MNKELLFMLENGEEFIKGIYEAKEDRIYFLSVDEIDTFENVEMLEENGDLVKTEDYTHNVGKCYRCHSTIEPRISEQWFVSMKDLASYILYILSKKNFIFSYLTFMINLNVNIKNLLVNPGTLFCSWMSVGIPIFAAAYTTGPHT